MNVIFSSKSRQLNIKRETARRMGLEWEVSSKKDEASPRGRKAYEQTVYFWRSRFFKRIVHHSNNRRDMSSTCGGVCNASTSSRSPVIMTTPRSWAGPRFSHSTQPRKPAQRAQVTGLCQVCGCPGCSSLSPQKQQAKASHSTFHHAPYCAVNSF